MTLTLDRRTALIVYVLYNAIVFGFWAGFKVPYAYIGSPEHVVHGIVLPVGLGALFLAWVTSATRSWREVWGEQKLASPWPPASILMLMFVMLGLMWSATHWDALAPQHLMLLAAGTLCVGLAETLNGIVPGLVSAGPGAYRKAGS